MSPTVNLQPSSVPRERRRHQRFPISSAAQVILSGVRGDAVTVDISSGGVLFKSNKLLPLGRRVELLIDWPVALDDRCPLRLMIHGRILRSDLAGTAVEIVRYDYRTRSRAPTPLVA
jgi:hypothetical protein